MRKRPLIALLALVATTITLSTVWAAGDADTTSLEGKPAPEISLKTLDGKDFKLSEHKGDVVIVDFWATWCPPCRESLPHLNKVAENKDLAAKGLKVFAVDAREEADVVKKFVETNKYSFTVPMDAKGEAMSKYMVNGIPTTLVIGRDGTIKHAYIGFGGEESAKTLDQAIEAALKEAKPAK